MDVSVIIPTFRRPVELAEALDSVRAQQGVAWEATVVDDCPDGSAAPVAAGDSRVRYMRNPSPSGGRPAAARNLAWPSAQGEIVHFLDDDRVPTGHYARARAEFAARPGLDVVFGRVEPFGLDERQVAGERAFFARAERMARRLRHFGPRWGFAAQMLCGESLLVCGAGLIRRQRITALQGFDQTLPLMEDVDFYARAIERFGGHFTDWVTLHYRIGRSLMRQPDVDGPVGEAYRGMQGRFRQERGRPNLYLRQVLVRLMGLAA